MKDLPIIQKSYDLIKWYIPVLNRLPREHKFHLGSRMISQVYKLMEDLIRARYQKNKLPLLESINCELDILRQQTCLLLDFELISSDRFQYVNRKIDGIGSDLGGWIRQQRQRHA